MLFILTSLRVLRTINASLKMLFIFFYKKVKKEGEEIILAGIKNLNQCSVTNKKQYFAKFCIKFLAFFVILQIFWKNNVLKPHFVWMGTPNPGQNMQQLVFFWISHFSINHLILFVKLKFEKFSFCFRTFTVKLQCRRIMFSFNN